MSNTLTISIENRHPKCFKITFSQVDGIISGDVYQIYCNNDDEQRIGFFNTTNGVLQTVRLSTGYQYNKNVFDSLVNVLLYHDVGVFQFEFQPQTGQLIPNTPNQE